MSARPASANAATGIYCVQPHAPPCGKGESKPPKKRIVARHDTVIMLEYSAMKNIANLKLAYSVWNPPTSSCSASTRSNGARLVSATAAVKKRKKPITCGIGEPIKFQRGTKPQWNPCCDWTISLKLSVPAIRTTPTTDIVSVSS